MAQAGPAEPSRPQIPTTTREIWLNTPSIFDGTRKKFTPFIQAVLVYTSINAHIFNTDELRIGFTLFFLTEKEAAQ